MSNSILNVNANAIAQKTKKGKKKGIVITLNSTNDATNTLIVDILVDDAPINNLSIDNDIAAVQSIAADSNQVTHSNDQISISDENTKLNLSAKEKKKLQFLAKQKAKQEKIEQKKSKNQKSKFNGQNEESDSDSDESVYPQNKSQISKNLASRPGSISNSNNSDSDDSDDSDSDSDSEKSNNAK